MERTLAAFSAIVLLIGCFTGCGMSDEPKKIRIPDITFMYTNSFEDTYAMSFCDSAGNYYTAVSDDVKTMGLDRLREEYAAGTLGSSDIRLVKNCDKTALEKAYTKLVKASGAEGRELENLKKCAQKAKHRYEKKYQGTELRNHVFRYCVSQGYDTDDIYAVVDELEWENDEN